MMRNAKWFVAAALVMSTAGCVESMDSGYAAPSYGYGYGNGYYSNGYYAEAPYYSPPVVYSQTRYVPVPTPVPVPQHQADRSTDHRWDARHDEQRHDDQRHVDRQPSPPPATHNTTPPSHNATPSASHNDGNRHDASRDHDGDRRS